MQAWHNDIVHPSENKSTPGCEIQSPSDSLQEGWPLTKKGKPRGFVTCLGLIMWLYLVSF